MCHRLKTKTSILYAGAVIDQVRVIEEGLIQVDLVGQSGWVGGISGPRRMK